ncbi:MULTISPECIES: hypothetical protein [unclassified Pseudoalteromonas]|uniref:hypothetical protein n=1 Tax=unclassified Pseudoalteromonas TaxID=194690 RepID=UPI001022E7F5|nr:hypothetical protein [Pseudoalteromonas sp. L1]RZF90509.1 hypothetical protein EXT42_18885 [Pseudoalteromonas sp. CO302Y]RZG06309.1 hypothetical protein EXT40_18890 [Pseudoalteromonas sp. CO133X]
MKKLYFSGLIAALLSCGVSANTNEIDVEANTSFTRSTTSVEQVAGSATSLSTATYLNPVVRVNNSYRNFFVGSLSGNQFCKEQGHKEEVTGSSVKCGEDESSYAEYDWYDSAWVSKSTGSKNQCYPLYASIKCGN